MPQDSLFSLTGVFAGPVEKPVLGPVDLEIPAGRVTTLVGPSGSGKTTLLRLLNRLDEPCAGTLSYRGRPIAEYPVRELRRDVGFVFQVPTMLAGSVRDNLQLPRTLFPEDPAEHRTPEQLLALVQMDAEVLDQEAESLSVGQKQRVALGRALASSPSTLLLDEPTASLDTDTADQLVATIQRLAAADEVSVVMVTHRLDEVRSVSDYTAVIEKGAIVRAGPTADVLSDADGAPR